MVAEDNFACAHTPGAEVCPSAQLVADAGGTYQVGVLSAGECRGTEAEYVLTVDASSDPGLTQIYDSEPIDPEEMVKKMRSLNAEGSGTLLRE